MKTKVESFEDIVFENRNKAYGAYELRKRYTKRGTISLIIAVSMVLCAFGGPLIMDDGESNDNIIVAPTGPITLDPVKPNETIKPPVLPKEINRNDFRLKPPRIVDEPDIEEELPPIDELVQNPNANLDDTSSSNSKGDIGFVKEIKPVVEEIFESFAIQEKPKFKDGDASLIRYVAENTKYPVPAQEQGIEGTVYIRFVVTKTGDVDKASVMRSVDPMLDEEALRVVKTIPKWTPGKNNGNPVNVWFILPVKFTLK